jgi:hypothetical protein
MVEAQMDRDEWNQLVRNAVAEFKPRPTVSQDDVDRAIRQAFILTIIYRFYTWITGRK